MPNFEKGKPQPEACREAGQRNLAEHNERVARGEAEANQLKHGAWSKHVRERYSDARTAEGRRLNAVIESIQDDLGGVEELSAGQSMILSFLRTKLIVIWQIADYIDKQMSVLTLIPGIRNYPKAKGLEVGQHLLCM